MSTRRMIAMDLDGTLLAGDHRTVSHRTRSALERCAERGIEIVPASGRALGLMAYELAQLPSISYAVSSNGASVTALRSGEHVHRPTVFDPTRAEQICSLLERSGASFEVYHRGNAYIERRKLPRFRASFAPGFATHLIEHSILIDDFAALIARPGVEKFNVSRIGTGGRDRVLEALGRDGDVVVSSSLGDNLEISPGGVSKATALAGLAELIGIDASDVVAFGDSGNDIAMLEWAGLSFAMGNATPEARRSASRVTCSNEDDGIAVALEGLLVSRAWGRFASSPRKARFRQKSYSKLGDRS